MKRIKERTTLLVVADEVDRDSYQKFNRESRSLAGYGLDYVSLSYDDLLNKIPLLNTEKVIVFFFFPFDYWNKKIEPRDYEGLYGNRSFYDKFISFWRSVDWSIRSNLPDKAICFVNSPLASGRYRDKVLVRKIISRARVPTPKLCHVAGVKDIYRHLNMDRKLFLKVRYGSMGKGITFLTKDRWKTNFTYRSNRILSRKSDHGWTFKDITANDGFLKRLLKEDIYIEEAVDPMPLKKKIFDLRFYTFFHRVLYIYPRTNDFEKVTTNISQGGKGRGQSFLRLIPAHLIALAKGEAIRSTKALGLNFAGVDVILDRNLKDVYILDVNLFPGFPKVRTHNLAKSLVKELGRLYKEGGFVFESKSKAF